MTTKEIYLLLVDAANDVINGDGRKVNEIQIILEDSINNSKNLGTTYDKARYDGFGLLISHLYVDTLNNNPKLLPKLLPVFVLACGEDKGISMLSDIDWNFVNTIM